MGSFQIRTLSGWPHAVAAAVVLSLFAADHRTAAQGPAAPPNAAPPAAAPAADGKKWKEIAIAIGSGSGSGSAADGKKWKEIAIPEELGSRGAERLRILRELPLIMSGQTPLDDNGKQLIESYIVRTRFAEMTQVANLSKLTEIRQEVRNRSIRNATIPEPVHTYINELVFTNMGRIARDDGFHPAVRVNAMYMVAELNQTEPVRGGAAAKPLPSALIARGGLLDAAADATLLPAVRAMALYGVQRHADAGIAGGNQAAVLASMTTVLKEKLPGGADSQTAWLKMRAADVLGTIGVADPQGAVAGSLGATVSDPAAPIAVRCAAARALGSLKGLTAAMIQLPDVIAGLGNLQLDLCRAELDRALYEQDAVSPRQIHFRTSAVQAALGDGKGAGIAILVPEADAQKPLLDGITANVAATLALVPDENANPAEQLKTNADELEKLLVDNKVLKSQPRATAAPATTPETTPAAASSTAGDAASAAATPAAKAN